MTPDELTSETT